MTQYIIILLDDTSVSFCNYANEPQKRNLIPLDTLKKGIVYAMKENLNIQFVYPHYPLPQDYLEAIDSIDHSDIKPASLHEQADVLVFDGVEQTRDYPFTSSSVYVLRTGREELFAHTADICTLLDKANRLNIVITDIEHFTEDDFERYKDTLRILSEKVESVYLSGKSVQLNLLTDRMMLDKMNNCGAGDTCITLAPDGCFYACPAFYLTKEEDGMGSLKASIGNLQNGLCVKNPLLYRLDHAPICRHCDAYQCRRCIWLNRKTTLEVNTPSHEQCVVAHLERNASRALLDSIRKHAEFLPEHPSIKEIAYLDPFDLRKEWN